MATMREGMPKIQNDHLQLPNSEDIAAEEERAINEPNETEIWKKLIAIPLSLGGNHLKTRAEPGAKIHPAASPFVNL